MFVMNAMVFNLIPTALEIGFLFFLLFSFGKNTLRRKETKFFSKYLENILLILNQISDSLFKGLVCGVLWYSVGAQFAFVSAGMMAAYTAFTLRFHFFFYREIREKRRQET